MHISWYNTVIPKCGQILEKSRYTVYKVPLTKNSLLAPLVARKKYQSNERKKQQPHFTIFNV